MDNIGGKDLQKGRSDGQGSQEQRTSNKAEDAATGLRWISVHNESLKNRGGSASLELVMDVQKS